MTEHVQADEMPRTDEEWKNYVAQSFRDGKARMDQLEAGIKSNTAEIERNTTLTMELKADTREMVEIFKAVKGGLRVLGWFGTAAKWLGGIAAAGTAIYGFGHMITQIFTGHWPPK